jgi:hypothetical protein
VVLIIKATNSSNSVAFAVIAVRVQLRLALKDLDS